MRRTVQIDEVASSEVPETVEDVVETTEGLSDTDFVPPKEASGIPTKPGYIIVPGDDSPENMDYMANHYGFQQLMAGQGIALKEYLLQKHEDGTLWKGLHVPLWYWTVERREKYLAWARAEVARSRGLNVEVGSVVGTVNGTAKLVKMDVPSAF